MLLNQSVNVRQDIINCENSKCDFIFYFFGQKSVNEASLFLIWATFDIRCLHVRVKDSSNNK